MMRSRLAAWRRSPRSAAAGPRLLALTAVLAVLSPQPALAAPITYGYTGSVTNATGIFAGQGTSVTGTFTFDDRMVDWAPDPYRDKFSYRNPDGALMLMGATVNVGSAAVVIRPTEHVNSGIVLTDGFHSFGCTDLLGCDNVDDSVSYAIYDYFTSVIRLVAQDGSNQAITPAAGGLASSSAGLMDLFDHLDLSRFSTTEGYVELGSWEAPHDQLWFTWTSVSRVQGQDPTTVPEPATPALLALGLLGLIGATCPRERAARPAGFPRT